jgi:glycosyltransferase involved in cell wall biosynthesis
MAKKTALILADFIFPEYLGGSARLASELNDSLVEAGFDVTCITRRPTGQYSSSFQASRVYRVVYIDRIGSVLALLVFGKWDVVISHHFTLGILSYFFRNKSNLILYFFHGPVHLERLSRGGSKVSAILRRGIEYFVLMHQKRIFCLSDYMKCHLANAFQSKTVITGPLHNFTITTPPPLKLPRLGLINLLTVRRLTNRTGVLELAETASKLHGAVTLSVVGGGELLDSLREMEYPNVKVLGKVADDELDRLYRQSDLVILPSLELEGFGLIIIESILRGTPVLASDKAGGGAEFLREFSADFIYSLDSGEAQFLDSVKRAIDAYANDEIRFRLLASISDFNMMSFINKHLTEENK